MDGLARAEVPKPLRLHRGGFTNIFYNNCEFIPMVEAINKMFIFYRAKNLDTFKDAISLPGLAYKMLVKPPR